MKKMLLNSQVGIIITGRVKVQRKFMAFWSPEEIDIQKLKNLALFSWDAATRKKSAEALASFRKTALPALTDVATATWDPDLRSYILDKIKEINQKP